MTPEQTLRIIAIAQLWFILAAGVWLVGGGRKYMPTPLFLGGVGAVGALGIFAFGLMTNLAVHAELTPGLLVAAFGLVPFTAVTAVAVVIAARRHP